MGKLLDLANRSLENKSKEELLMADIKLHSNPFILYPPFFERADDLPDLEWKKSLSLRKAENTFLEKRGCMHLQWK
ncbi:hypothetical protein BTN99_06310 [Vibrio campbellii]|nr:hypothetical protein BTN99_06310 [Vibrio campbellii]